MADVTIYHNPQCSKSRQAIELLDARGTAYDVVRYKDQHPTRAQLTRLLEIVDAPTSDLVRWNDARKADLDLPDHDDAAAVLELLVAHPELLERPIVVRGERGVIGRPTEAIADLLDR